MKWRLWTDAADIEEFRGKTKKLLATKAELKVIAGEASQLVVVFHNLDAEIAEYASQINARVAARQTFDELESSVRAAGSSARRALKESGRSLRSA